MTNDFPAIHEKYIYAKPIIKIGIIKIHAFLLFKISAMPNKNGACQAIYLGNESSPDEIGMMVQINKNEASVYRFWRNRRKEIKKDKKAIRTKNL